MAVITSSGGSSSVCENNGPCLNVEEVGKRFDLDSKTVNWLKKESVNVHYPILVLTYQNAFLKNGDFDVNQQTVSTALVELGATLISGNVFKFDDWATMYDAKRTMWRMPSCFYTENLVKAQQLKISHQPTITTTVISWHCETPGNLTYQPFQFFET